MPVLKLNRLSKQFRKRLAVDGLSLCVEQGDIYGFLGPNGAGKTTTMRMIVGLIRPTGGTVELLGKPCTSMARPQLYKVGALIESPEHYRYMSGRQNLRMLADLSGGCSPSRIDEVLDRVGIRDRADDPVRIYSQGMKRRLAIASALIPAPELVLLDEPTSGLDPVGIRDIRKLIVSLARDDNLTVFLSSHLLAEVEQMCNRGAIIAEGKRLWEGEVSELLSARRRIRVRASPSDKARQLCQEVLSAEIKSDPDDADLFYLVGGEIMPEDVVDVLVAEQCRVREIAAELPPLEEVFVEFVEGP